MSCYVHDLPGRLRVRVPAAKGNVALLSDLARRLNGEAGITSVQATPVTGSILIRYDTRATNAAACLAILDVASFPEPDRPGISAKIAEAATWYLFEKAVERCFPLVLAALF